VKSILYVPFSDKTHEVTLGMKVPAGTPNLFPGMTVEAEITVYEKKDAVAIPGAAVKKEGDKESVTLKDGKIISVKTGRSSGSSVEILHGLKPGDVVQLPSSEKGSEKGNEDKKDSAKETAESQGEKPGSDKGK
jgi:multidrug efflux pump subunit AcrA (membrane-fusion protein)